MRGWPPGRAIAALFAILLAAWPVWGITRPRLEKPQSPPKAERPEMKEKVELEIVFTSPPDSFVVLHLGKPVWEETTVRDEMRRELNIAFPHEGIDLEIRLRWPEGVRRAAAGLRLTDPDGGQHEASVWGQGETDEVVTFR